MKVTENPFPTNLRLNYFSMFSCSLFVQEGIRGQLKKNFVSETTSSVLFLKLVSPPHSL